jgi:hypothetical protein
MIMLDPPSGGGQRRAGAAQRPAGETAGDGGEYEFPETDFDDDLPF